MAKFYLNNPFGLLFLLGLATFLSCTKDAPAPTSSTLTFVNNTSTKMTFVINGKEQYAESKNRVVLTGKPGDRVTGTSTTSGLNDKGDIIGEQLSWTINESFPKSGDFLVDYYADNGYFFLKIVNSSAYTISKLYVNYGFVDQSFDAVDIPGDHKIHSMGYYRAFSNTNVRAEGSAGGFAFGTIVLPGTNNQEYTFNIN